MIDGGTVVILDSPDEAVYVMELFDGEVFFVNAHWSTDEEKWLLDDGTPAFEGYPIDVPPGSSDTPCLLSMNGVLTPATCDEARNFLCELPGTPGPEDEDDETARDEGYDICENPIDIQCQNLITGEILENGDVGSDGLVCTLEDGAQCDNKMYNTGTTHNYCSTSHNNCSTTHNNCSTTHNYCSTTHNDCSTTNNDCSTTHNYCSTTHNYCSTTHNDCSTNNNDCSTTHNDCSTTHNDCSTTHNYCSTTHNYCSTTHNDCSTTHNYCSTTHNDCSTTHNYCCTTHNDCSTTHNDCSTTHHYCSTTHHYCSTTHNNM
uniref:C-type lectin domain-containing protein n=1 Tax=Branchiostoma floridae TaxID=7739 RepID=C3YMU4_BRAFL|eukprot:XP_002602423.1 hypothetical protein BRAFLDRAFT_63486 [Branchiostoma floridae]